MLFISSLKLPASRLLTTTAITGLAVASHSGAALASGETIVVDDAVTSTVEAQDNGNSITVTGTGSITESGDGVYVYDDYGDDVIDNTVTNDGTIDVGDDGVELYSSGDLVVNTVSNNGTILADGDGVYLYAEDDIIGNEVSNSGSIDAGENGVYLYAYDGDVSGNEVSNSGSIDAEGDGVDLRAEYDDVLGNTVVNSGSITADDDGIDLDAYYDLSGNTVTNSGTITAADKGFDVSAYEGDVLANTLTNSGTITAGSYYGDEHRAAIYVSSYYGDIGDNTVANSGTINAGYDADGIEIYAYEGDILGNTISNSGTITADDNGIDVDVYYGGSLDGNTITNSGTITSGDEGINIDAAYGITDNSFINSGVINAGGEGIEADVDYGDFAYNTLTNSGTITAGSDGIEIDAYGEFSNNALTNSGVIAAEDDGIEIDTSYYGDMYNNSIMNSGVIEADDGFGISLNADGYAWDYDSDTSGNSSSASATATSEVYSAENVITNSGSITSTESGIDITVESYAYAEANASSSDTDSSIGVASASASSTAQATASAYSIAVDNTITNTGDIFAFEDDEGYGGNGIRIYAYAGATAYAYASAFTDADSNTDSSYHDERATATSTATATATTTAQAVVADNFIYNSGVIFAEQNGIYLSAEADAFTDATATAVADATNHSPPGYNYGVSETANEYPTENETYAEIVVDNEIVNSGKVIGVYGDAIHIGGSWSSETDYEDFEGSAYAGNSLTLSAPSFIGGDIYLNYNDGGYNSAGIGATAVEITTGPSHSTLWHMSGNVFEGLGADNVDSDGVPYWIIDQGGDGYTVATFDPTVISSTTDQFMDMSGALANGVNGAKAQADSNGVFAFTNATKQLHLGNETTTLNNTTNQQMTVGGFSTDLEENASALQMYVGQVDSNSSASSQFATSFDRDVSGVVGGANLRFGSEGTAFELGVSGGAMDVTMDRFINANLADNGCVGDPDGDCDATLGEAWANSETTAQWWAPTAAFSYTSDAVDGTSITLNARATYTAATIGGYVETTDNDDIFGDDIEVATVGAQSFAAFETAISLNATRTLSEGASITFGGGMLTRNPVTQGDVDVTMYEGSEDLVDTDDTQGVSNFFAASQVPFVNAGITFSDGNTVLDIYGQGTYVNEELGGTVGASIGIKF